MEISVNRDEIVQQVSSKISDVKDFPKPGILFKDITPVLKDGETFQKLVHLFVSTIPKETTQLLAIESRGFIFASAIAHHMGIGMVLVRKPGKLPKQVVEHTYKLEYGTDTLQIHKEDLTAEDKVIVIDDVLATGGTAHAVESLCEKIGAQVLGHRFLMEIEFLKGRDNLSADIDSFITC